MLIENFHFPLSLKTYEKQQIEKLQILTKNLKILLQSIMKLKIQFKCFDQNPGKMRTTSPNIYIYKYIYNIYLEAVQGRRIAMATYKPLGLTTNQNSPSCS